MVHLLAGDNAVDWDLAWKKWVGIGLIGLSGVWFAGILLVPFSQFSLGIAATLEAGFFLDGGFVLAWDADYRKAGALSILAVYQVPSWARARGERKK